jgi:hypothetical protein
LKNDVTRASLDALDMSYCADVETAGGRCLDHIVRGCRGKEELGIHQMRLKRKR